MDVTIIVILAGALAAGLGVLVLRLGKRLAILLLVLGGLGVAGAVAAAMFAQAQATRQAAQAATVAAAGQATTSAAMSIVAFLLALVVLLLLAITGAALGWLWWQKRQKQARLQEALEMVQYHALMNGGQLPAYQASRPAIPRLPQAGGNVFVLPSQPATPAITLDDLTRALQAAQGQADPLVDLLPPDDEWRVLE